MTNIDLTQEELEMVLLHREKRALQLKIKQTQEDCVHEWRENSQFFEAVFRYKCDLCNKEETSFSEWPHSKLTGPKPWPIE